VHFVNLLLDFMVQGEISEADTPTIQLDTTPSGLINNPPPSSLQFFARCPSCRNPPNLSWLGTGTKYAGLHTQWLPVEHKLLYFNGQSPGELVLANSSSVVFLHMFQKRTCHRFLSARCPSCHQTNSVNIQLNAKLKY